jgi:peptide-methionine (R)-S-oxide reductase
MKLYFLIALFITITLSLTGCTRSETKGETAMSENQLSSDSLDNQEVINRTDEEWQKILTPEQFYVLRKKGTERPYTGKYDQHFEEGIYFCAGCGTELFKSETKFDAGCGWPSFYQPSSESTIKYEEDTSLMMRRTEVLCSKCGGHLGHVFNDGPNPTGLRYCINSVSLNFVKKEGQKIK